MRCARFLMLICCLSVVVLCLVSCEKKKEGKLEVTQQSFQLRQFSDNGWSIDATGKIKNIGEVDVKKVAVTGRCKTCVDVWIPGKWFVATESEDISVSDKDEIVKSIGAGDEEYAFDQVDIIGYIAIGTEEEFQAKDIAYFYTRSADQKPDPMPTELDIIVKSFETFDK